VAIYSANDVWATGFVASSDRRIKENIMEINDGDALSKLRNLNPTTYNYIDKVSKSSEKVYGFIAQEVKEVLPYAVSLQAEIIPNIYSLGDVSESNNITLTKAHELVVGNKVRIFNALKLRFCCRLSEFVIYKCIYSSFTIYVFPIRSFIC
jgi:hypothetical protein